MKTNSKPVVKINNKGDHIEIILMMFSEENYQNSLKRSGIPVGGNIPGPSNPYSIKKLPVEDMNAMEVLKSEITKYIEQN